MKTIHYCLKSLFCILNCNNILSDMKYMQDHVTFFSMASITVDSSRCPSDLTVNLTRCISCFHGSRKLCIRADVSAAVSPSVSLSHSRFPFTISGCPDAPFHRGPRYTGVIGPQPRDLVQADPGILVALAKSTCARNAFSVSSVMVARSTWCVLQCI